MSFDIKQAVGAMLMIIVGGVLLSTNLEETTVANYQWIGYVPIIIGIIYLAIIIKSNWS